MFEKLDYMSSDVSNLIIYTNSAMVQTVLKKKIKEIFKIDRNLTKYADTSNDLKAVKNDTMTQPFGGGEWLVDIQTDKIPLKDLIKEIKIVTTSSRTIYWTSNYSQYRKLIELDVVKKQGRYCFEMYAGRLYPEDVSYLYKMLVPSDKTFSKELMDFVKKNYLFDAQSVCDLFQSIAQGDDYSNTQDIISKIGIGGNTVDSLVLKLLTTNPKTEKGTKKSLENFLKLLTDLSFTYDYRTIRNYMKTTISTIVEIKQLQIMGRYTLVNKNIPEEKFNVEKIQRLKRYERTILEDINMGRVLNLRIAMGNYNSFNAEEDLIKMLSSYLGTLCYLNTNNPDSNEMPVKRRRKL